MKTHSLRHLLLALLALVAATSTLPVQGQPALYVEGSHYTVLPDNSLSRTQATAAVPLVTEVFWYGCPHCFDFDPLLANWVQQQGASINFSRSPAVWDSNTQRHARLFAASQELGMLEQVHLKIFTEIHRNRNFLLDAKAQLAFLQANGSTADSAEKALNSFAVDTQVRKAEALQRELKVPTIPAMVVRGKYLVHLAGPVRTHEDMLKVVEFLLMQAAPG